MTLRIFGFVFVKKYNPLVFVRSPKKLTRYKNLSPWARVHSFQFFGADVRHGEMVMTSKDLGYHLRIPQVHSDLHGVG